MIRIICRMGYTNEETYHPEEQSLSGKKQDKWKYYALVTLPSDFIAEKATDKVDEIKVMPIFNSELLTGNDVVAQALENRETEIISDELHELFEKATRKRFDAKTRQFFDAVRGVLTSFEDELLARLRDNATDDILDKVQVPGKVLEKLEERLKEKGELPYLPERYIALITKGEKNADTADPVIILNTAQRLANLGKFSDAAELLEKVLLPGSSGLGLADEGMAYRWLAYTKEHEDKLLSAKHYAKAAELLSLGENKKEAFYCAMRSADFYLELNKAQMALALYEIAAQNSTDIDAGDVIAIAMFQAGCALEATGDPRDAAKAFLSALDTSEVSKEPALKFKLLISLGAVYSQINEKEEAIKTLQDAITVGKNSKVTPAQMAMAHFNLGRVFEDLEKPESALPLYRGALDFAKSVTDLRKIATIYHHMAVCTNYTDTLEKTALLYEDAIETAVAAKFPQQESKSCYNLALVYQEAEMVDVALELFKKVEEIGDKTGWDLREKAETMLNMAFCHQAQNLFKEAEWYYELAAEAAEQVEYPIIIGKSLHNIGIMKMAMGLLNDAQNNFEESVRMKERLRDFEGMLLSLKELIHIMTGKNDFVGALIGYKKGLEAATAIDNKKDMIWAYHNMALMYQNLGEYDQALPNYYSAYDTADLIQDKDAMGMALFNIALIKQNEGFLEQAKGLYEDCLKIARELKDKLAIAKCCAQLGILLYSTNEKVRAVPFLLESFNLFRELKSPEIAKVTGLLTNIRTQPMGSQKK